MTSYSYRGLCLTSALVTAALRLRSSPSKCTQQNPSRNEAACPASFSLCSTGSRSTSTIMTDGPRSSMGKR